MTISSATLIFLAALGGGFSHCIGMCGGIVLGYSNGKSSLLSSSKIFLSHLLYNFGRISTYVIIGLVAWSLGAFLNIHNAYVAVILGALLILMAIGYKFFPRLIAKIEPNITHNNAFSRAMSYLLRSRKLHSFYFLGFLNGFLPCGMVYFFTLHALTFHAPLDAALCMLIFGIGNSIPLLGLGLFFSIKGNFRTFLSNLSFIFMLTIGVYQISLGIMEFMGHHNHHHHGPLVQEQMHQEHQNHQEHHTSHHHGH